MSDRASYALSSAAQSDLESIWDDSLRHWGEAQAETYTRSIRAACEALAKGTSAGRSAEEIREGYRKVAVGSHVMLFRIRDDAVQIMRILHQSMDVDRHL